MSGTSTQPNYRVTMNGKMMSGVESVTVSPPLAYRIGTFHLEKVLFQDDAFPFSWWGSTATKAMLVTIEVTLDGQQYETLITGNVDSHSYDFNSNVISFSGRDLAAQMVDQRYFTTYRNKTASEIAAEIAGDHQLTISATPTKTIVGRYYDTDHDASQTVDGGNASNEWDLLCQIGSKEGIIPYVVGSTLYFNATADNPPNVPYFFTRDQNGIPFATAEGATFERHLTFARDVSVTVISWHSKKKGQVSETVRTHTKEPASGQTQPVQKWVFRKPNLTSAQALALAQQYALELSQHERPITIRDKIRQILPPQCVVQISGTNTDYDRAYVPQSISYSLSAKSGTSLSIQAKFCSPILLYNDETGAQIGELA